MISNKAQNRLSSLSLSSLFFFLIFFGFTGCGSLQYSFIDKSLNLETQKNKDLSVAVLNYYEALSKKDFKEAYSFELPHLQFQKSLDFYEKFYFDYKGFHKTTLLSIQTIDKDRAIVSVNIEYKDNHYQLQDRWVFVNGLWKHYNKFSILPDPYNPF